ncbi:alkaline phosphatase family protein [Sphingomonas natans]|uniref:alkaline phosphatase family protein n=1 Tax=Sphingomonas natans TaxID=3063330 RepID=UPI003D67BF94
MKWWAACVALGVANAAPASPVLLISLDGLRPGDVTAQRTPRLAALAREGTHAKGVTGVLPTLTYPSHTTLVTGVSPAEHGIANNLTFDPLNINQQGWYWYASDVKVPTLWQAAHAKGLRTANVHWPVTVGAAGIDENLPQIWRTGSDDDRKMLAALATPGLLPRLEAALGPYAQGIDETVEGDAVRVRFAARILIEDKPDLLTIYLAGIDHEEHRSGPGSAEADATITKTDALVGQLIDAARQARPDITIAVVSDHGFLPVSTDVNLFAPFIAAGLVTLDKDQRVSAWEAEPWIAGGTAAIRLARPDDAALVARVRALLAKLAADPAYHIAAVLDRAAIEKVGGPREASFLVALQPGFETGRDPAAPVTSASVYKGMHGYLPEYPAMQSTFIVAGPGIAPRGDLGQIDMRAIAPMLAKTLGVDLPAAARR